MRMALGPDFSTALPNGQPNSYCLNSRLSTSCARLSTIPHQTDNFVSPIMARRNRNCPRTHATSTKNTSTKFSAAKTWSRVLTQITSNKSAESVGE